MVSHLYLYLISLAVIATSCEQRQTKFNQSEWNTPNDIIDYNHREPMIDDLRNNYIKQGMKAHEIKELLGNTESITVNDSIQLHYEIFTDYGYDIDPVETKYLIINFDIDSTLINTRIQHYKK